MHTYIHTCIHILVGRSFVKLRRGFGNLFYVRWKTIVGCWVFTFGSVYMAWLVSNYLENRSTCGWRARTVCFILRYNFCSKWREDWHTGVPFLMSLSTFAVTIYRGACRLSVRYSWHARSCARPHIGVHVGRRSCQLELCGLHRRTNGHKNKWSTNHLSAGTFDV